MDFKYDQNFLNSLDAIETRAMELLGMDKLEILTALIPKYGQS